MEPGCLGTFTKGKSKPSTMEHFFGQNSLWKCLNRRTVHSTLCTSHSYSQAYTQELTLILISQKIKHKLGSSTYALSIFQVMMIHELTLLCMAVSADKMEA